MNKIFIWCVFIFSLQIEAPAATHTYDPLHRLTSVVYSPSQRIDYVYDAAGNLIEERVNGSQGLTVSAQASPAAGGSVSISPVQSGYVAGDTVTATATPSAGYTFTGWSGNSACTTNSACTFTVPTSSVSLVANFAAPSGLFPLRVNALPSVGGTVTPSVNSAGYAPGTSITLTATPAAGYVIDYWYGAACTNYSGPSCTFSMPAHSSDVFVRFKLAGSGYLLSYASSSPVAGVLDILPSQDRIPAGAAVTLRVLAASGYRFSDIRFTINGVYDYTICSTIQNFFFIPGETPTCTFNMPASDVAIDVYYVVDPDRYALDITASPMNGGTTSISVNPDTSFAYYYTAASGTATKLLVTGGISTTLTAKPAGARPFIKWINGPCINSTNPVCTFNMPNVATVSNPLFGDEPHASCTYSVSAPSLAFTGAGGSKNITVTTQAGCNFIASTQLGTVTTTGNVVTLTLDANITTTSGRAGLLRIHAGREVFIFGIGQTASAGTNIVSLSPINFGSVGAGDIPTVSTNVTLTNGTGVSQNLQRPTISGPFAISANTCASPLVNGASCVISLQFVPNKDGVMTGELLQATTGLVWSTALTGTAMPTRFNVAAARKGSTVVAAARAEVVNYNEIAVTNGDRRGSLIPDQGFWFVQTTAATDIQPIEIKFASPQSVEWLYLFGRPKDSGFYSDYSPTTLADGNVAGNEGFTVEYWTGSTWVAVSELLRVGSPNMWQRVKFSPVTTDRVRLKLTPPYTNQVIVSEIEVWTVASDIAPVAFTFSSVTDVAPSTLVTSAAVTPTGYNAATPITVTGGSYSIGCGGVFSASAGTIEPGQSVCVRHISNASSAGTATTTLTIGGVSGIFVSTTRTVVVVPTDVTPDPIAAQSRSNVAPAIEINFTAVSVTGINTNAIVSMVNGEFSVGCNNNYTSLASSVSNGASICVRHMSSPSLGQTVTSVLTIGSLNVGFSSTTIAQIVAPSRLARRDFNHDGISDFVWRDMATGNTVVALMNGLIPTSTSIGVIGLNVSIQGVGDFDGDGKDDILWRNTSTGEAIVAFMDGGTVRSWTTVGAISLNLIPQGVGDYNGDGRDDIVWRNSSTGNIVISYMNGAAMTWGADGVAGIDERIRGIGDFNTDGKADILFRNVSSGNMRILYNTSISISSSSQLVMANFGTIPLELGVQGVGDFNGDAKDDILWRNQTTGEVFVSYLEDTVQTWHSFGLVALNLEIVGVGDYNGDGKDDILWRNTNTGNVSITYLNGSTLTWGNVGVINMGSTIYGK